MRGAVADDHGFHDCSFTGSKVQTPTIDHLRASGIALEQHCICPQPPLPSPTLPLRLSRAVGGADVQKVCSPTRTAIMTGRYPHRNGMQTPFCGGSPEGLNLNETLMSEYMNTAGSASPTQTWWPTRRQPAQLTSGGRWCRYTSHIVGKWHLGFTSWEHTPTFRGFSSFYVSTALSWLCATA